MVKKNLLLYNIINLSDILFSELLKYLSNVVIEFFNTKFMIIRIYHS